MTDPAGSPDRPLHVTADLHLDVDGVRAQLVGDGQRLQVTSEHPVRLVAAAARNRSARGALTAIADGLADSGLTVEVSGGHGLAAAAGHEVESRLGRALAGSSHVRLTIDPRWVFAAGAVLAASVAIGVRRFGRRRP